jgi:hypothetical protein
LTQNNGISSAGFGIFGDANFGGANLDDPVAVDGLNYGITSDGDDTSTGNAAVTGANPLIKNQVVFLLDGLPDDFVPSEDTILHVRFQYGTNLTEPHNNNGGGIVPEPAFYQMAALLGLGGLGLFRALRKGRQGLGVGR